jgi:hypothetical protein
LADFELATTRVVWLPVTWKQTVPGENDAATIVEQSIDLFVELVDKDEYLKLFVEPDAEADAEAYLEWHKVSEVERFRRIAKDWRKVRMNGAPATLDDENAGKMLRQIGFSDAFNRAYQRASMGVEEIRTGN